MNKIKLIWQERASKSEFVTSVWACSALIATRRTVLADPCISLSLIKEKNSVQVVLRGPETKSREEFLTAGYENVTIRLQPGVFLQGFPTQKFINKSLALPVDAHGYFELGSNRLQFPDFDNVELLIDQLYNLGYLRREVFSSRNVQTAKVISSRTHARRIKRTTGLSPYQLHQLQRIHNALRLLKQGVSAATVAADLDFVDQSHLVHASRQFLGHTPKELVRLPQNPKPNYVQNIQYLAFH